MAKKVRRTYVCQSCGHQEPKWLGRCPECGAWSSFLEEVAERAIGSDPSGGQKPVALAQVSTLQEARRTTGIVELDRVLGGGLVVGSLILVGGDPGIGKSTLLLQAAGAMAANGVRVLYVSAEESAAQVKLRAARLAIDSDNLFLLTETHMDAVEAARRELAAEVAVIDSIQTISASEAVSPVGSVSQIRAVTQQLMTMAKSDGVTTFVIGHVTKEGAIAGPKLMEHMVDTVLYFEGERGGPYRILRAHKNRFGSAQEIGVFEMQINGLAAVANPSQLFLAQRVAGPGAAVVTSVEGSRPLLLEVQALATASPYGTPRRTTIGIDHHRVAMLCAVLSARAGYELAGLDVYVNVAGGVRITEPAADLGVALALASSVAGRAVTADAVMIGEIGLSGEIRAVSQLEARVAEAAALGFSRCLVPQIDLERWSGPPLVLPLDGVSTIENALAVAGLS